MKPINMLAIISLFKIIKKSKRTQTTDVATPTPTTDAQTPTNLEILKSPRRPRRVISFPCVSPPTSRPTTITEVRPYYGGPWLR